MQAHGFDLAGATPVNHLWPQLVESLGLERSARAVRQALDLQAMRGHGQTLPLLLVDTCGVGLLERRQLREATGLPLPEADGLVLLYSPRQAALQLLTQSDRPG